MKIFIKITLFFLMFQLNAQENQGVVNNTGSTVLRAGSAVQSSYGAMAYFYNPKVKVEGSEYLFDKWENNAVVYTKDNYKYLLRNINLNLRMNLFVSKVAVDSIFTFNMQNINKIILEKKTYKSYFANGKERICQVVFESSEFLLLKNIHVQFIKASPNPMINRPNDKIIKRDTYYISKDNKLKKIKLTKRSILKLIDTSKLVGLKRYLKKNKLSYTNEEDVRKILMHASNI